MLWRNQAQVEADYEATRSKYDDAEWRHMATAFCLLIDALEGKREEFLGHCMTVLGATNRHNGQFLTPVSVSHMMGAMLAGEPRDEIVTLHDPCCGAGVLMIEGAEAMLEAGWKQCNIRVEAGDIDGRACDMCYVQLSLLGYAGIVRHMDTLTMKEYSEPRYTPGWFMHGFPMRGVAA